MGYYRLDPVEVFASLRAATDGYAVLTDTTDTVLIAAPGAGKRLHITSMAASNTSATPVRIDIKDGANVKHSFLLAADGGGFAQTFPFPCRLSENTALQVQLSGAVTDVRVSVVGFVL